MVEKFAIEKIRRLPIPLTFKERKSLIKKEIKQLKKSKRKKISGEEIYMKIEKKGGYRLYLVGDRVIDGPNLFAEGKIPNNVREI